MSATDGSKGTGTQILRTIAYHEITSTTEDIASHGDAMPVISKNGDSAVFVGCSPDEKGHIYVIKTDGTEPPRDVYSFKGWCDQAVDLSPDSTKVAASSPGPTNNNDILLADITSGKTSKFSVEGNMGPFRITDNGQVYFIPWGDTGIPGSNPHISVKRGLWRVNFDGSGLTQIVSFEKIAEFLGASADSIGFEKSESDLGISSDGSRLVFAVSSDKGKHILGISSDGTGLMDYAFPKDYISSISSVGISGDGSKIFYIISPNPCCSTPQETGVFNFDGSGHQVLIQGPGQVQDYGELSYDGSVLLAGREHGWLVNTKTGDRLELTALGGWDSSDPALVGDGMYLPSMDSSATKFLYLSKDASGKRQLVVAEMNPASLGQAPSITNPKIQPPFILTKEKSQSNVIASVTSSNTLVAVGTDFLLNGTRDESGAGRASLNDDGKNGDLSAGDGIFTGVIEGNRDLPVGPRIVRLKAEVKGTDGKRHATALDLWPFAVADGTDQANNMVNTPPPIWEPTSNNQTTRPQPPQPPNQPPGESEKINLTGIWSCNDGGIYYIRQLENTVWWNGEQDTANPHWVNVAHGTIRGDTVTLEYSDVPEGDADGFGTLVLDIVSNDELNAKEKPESYSGSHWVRSSKNPQPPINPPTTTNSGSATTTSSNQGSLNPWDTTQGQTCFKQWITEATSRLNNYNGDSEFNSRKPISFNKYGIWEDKVRHSAYAPDDFKDYNYNKYWYMWHLYDASTSTGWGDPNWNGAQVPSLHDYVQKCISLKA